MNLPWTITIEKEPDPEFGFLYIARVKDLPGVVSDGYSEDEARISLREALKLSLRMSLEEKEEFTLPI